MSEKPGDTLSRWDSRMASEFDEFAKRKHGAISPIQPYDVARAEDSLSRATSSSLTISGSLSESHLVGVSTRSALYRGKVVPEKRLVFLLVALAVIAVILIIALAVVSYYYTHWTPVSLCETDVCLRSAANLLSAMNQSVDPCEDFYKFACGRWAQDHPIPDSSLSQDWFTERSTAMMRTIKGFLQQDDLDEDPNPVKQARMLFQACMDVGQLENLGLEPMLTVLDQIGLKRRPLPSKGSGFDWMVTVVRAKRIISKEILIGFAVYADTKDRTINRLNIGPPDTRSPLPSGSKELEQHMAKIRRYVAQRGEVEVNSPEAFAYIQYMNDVMDYVNLKDAKQQVKVNYTEIAVQVQKFERKLFKVEEIEDKGEILDMTVVELQNMTDGLTSSFRWNWTYYFTLMFKNVENVTLTRVDQEIVKIRNIDYVKEMLKLVNATPRETLEMFMWWDVVGALGPHTVQHLRELRHTYINQVSGDLAPLTRSMFCAGAVNQMMGMAVSYLIVSPKFKNSTKIKVDMMLSDIRVAFKDLVRRLTWMDGPTKSATLEKAEMMMTFVGFPDWLLVPGELDKEYEGVNVNRDTYLASMVAILQLWVSRNLNTLRRQNPLNNTDSWITVPTDVNAYYTFQTNSINVPSAILHFPFYGLGLEALNYGAIGSILGHELTHGFDNSGRQYDKNGNMRQWWTTTTVDEYINRTACFVDQYSSYKMEGVDKAVDGTLTLGENIADNGGLREALGAYRNYVRRHGLEPKLPGFEDYSHEQLFFLSFANLWCQSWTQQSLMWMLRDEHSPNAVRVRGVLSNMQEFSETFKCDKGTALNPHRPNRCRLW